jgi:hypothetical protein
VDRAVFICVLSLEAVDVVCVMSCRRVGAGAGSGRSGRRGTPGDDTVSKIANKGWGKAWTSTVKRRQHVQSFSRRGAEPGLHDVSRFGGRCRARVRERVWSKHKRDAVNDATEMESFAEKTESYEFEYR